MIKSYLRILKISVLVSLLLPIVITTCSRVLIGRSSSPGFFLELLISIPAVAIAYFIVSRIFDRVKGNIEDLSKQQSKYLDSINITYVDVAIFLSAGVSLFLELSMIRWQSAVFAVFAFYKNYSLLACFAGLGLGYALAKRESIPLFLSIPVLAGQMLLLTSLRYAMAYQRTVSLMVTPFTERLDMGLVVVKSTPHFVAIYSFLLVVFLITALAFIPVGQLCGRLMSRRNNLRAYGLNLLGSIVGVVLVSGISFLWTPPVVWFSICFILLLAFQIFNPRLLFIGIFSSLISVIILTWPVSAGFEKIYSPYQLLERGSGPGGLSFIRAAGHFYQKVHDLSLSNANRSIDSTLRRAANYYELPYRVYGKKPRHVAVVGAGMGNDVAAALRRGADRVDAIEIDPAIWKVGKLYHPEKPYDDPRVDSIINDARTFLRTTDRKYDMVVYGLLDSHTLLSHASSVRLDSFVYTVEGLKEARARLKEGGLLGLSFCIISHQLGRKIYLMMEEAFDGVRPVCVGVNYESSVIFMQSKEGKLSLDKSLLQEADYKDVTNHYSNPAIKADVSTDDWPFFYMPRRIYPKSYLGILALMVLLSISITYNFFRQKLTFSSSTFFFLGAGFMLIEAKAITEMGLALGNTWHVIGVAISGILFMAFLANCFVQWLKISDPTVAFILLMLSLLAGFFVSERGGFDSSFVGKISTVVLLTCPMFFSGIVFSSLLSKAKEVTGVMAINLIGAMLGGVLEYNSMYFGFSFLYLLAIFLYLVAMGVFLLKKGN